MNNWRNICTLSLVHFMAFPEMQSGDGDFVGSIHQVAERKFFGALEMGLINDRAIREKIRLAASDLGFKLSFGAQPLILSQNLNLNHLDQYYRLQAVQQVKNAIDQAYEIGADRFVILSGKDPGFELRTEAYSALEESIVELGKYARQYHIHIILETFDRSVDKMALVGPSDAAAVFTTRIRYSYPEFGLLYDMGHMPLLDETPERALNALKGSLAQVHVGNCVKTPGLAAYGDKHPCFGYAGGVNGTMELVHFLKELFHIGYLQETPDADELPWVGFEIRPQEGETLHEILDNIQQTWQDAWSQL